MLTLLWLVIVAEVVAVFFLLVTLFASTAVRSAQLRRRTAIEGQWHDTTRLRLGGEGPADPTDDLSRLSARRRVTAISALVGSLSGEVVAAATGPADLAELRRRGAAWTRSPWWWRRLRGVRTLVQLDEPLAAYRSLLTDHRPEVRAEVADWVARDPTPEDISRLVSMLGTDVKRCRFAAENALRRIGAAAVPALTEYLSGPAEGAAVALDIVAAAGTPALIPVATGWSTHPDPANRAASAALLATIGTDQAGGVLIRLLEDPDPQVRAAAATGLGDVAMWSAAPQLTQRLHDPDWSVRRSSAAALRGLGPVGRLCLRRAVDDPDPRAAEIARHVLDLPESALSLEAR
jgi:hypothetical protein